MRNGNGLESELGAAVLGDQVGVLGVAGDEGAGERAEREHGHALLAGLVQDGGDQVTAEAGAAEPGIGLGVDGGEPAAGPPVLDEAAELTVGLDLVAGPLRMIFDQLSHCAPLAPALPGTGELSYRYGVSEGQTGRNRHADAVTASSCA